MSIDSITWASDQTGLKRLQKAKVFNEMRSSHDAVGRASWKAGVLLRSSKNAANRPHAAKRFSRLRGSGSSRRCRTAIGLFPKEQWVQRSAITMLDYASMLPRVLDNRCGVRPTLPASPVSCIETTWEAPMRLAGMCGEPEYDVEKSGEAAQATGQGYRPATQSQREVSTRRGTAKGMTG